MAIVERHQRRRLQMAIAAAHSAAKPMAIDLLALIHISQMDREQAAGVSRELAQRATEAGRPFAARSYPAAPVEQLL